MSGKEKTDVHSGTHPFPCGVPTLWYLSCQFYTPLADNMEEALKVGIGEARSWASHLTSCSGAAALEHVPTL